MINQTNSAGLGDKLATDIKDIGALRQSARQNSPDALKASAKQFEALFMNMVMKSMRDATPQNGVFDSEQSKMFTSMLDQQLSQTMAERGVGLADVLTRQLSSVVAPVDPSAAKTGPVSDNALQPSTERPSTKATATDAVHGKPTRPGQPQPAHVQAFRDKLTSHAEEASRATGIPAKFMLGQAALESGWGKREIRGADGAASHNLFGIKATSAWKGKTVTVATTEYVNGVAQQRMEKFRAYDSYGDAFKDYARLLRNNPRYEGVIANAQDATGFAQGLQRAGYATDPQYASKLSRIIRQSFA